MSFGELVGLLWMTGYICGVLWGGRGLIVESWWSCWLCDVVGGGRGLIVESWWGCCGSLVVWCSWGREGVDCGELVGLLWITGCVV